MNGPSPFNPPLFTAERFCPYHGGFIALADCYIVATNDRYNGAAPRSERGRATERLADGLEEAIGAHRSFDPDQPTGSRDDPGDGGPEATRLRRRVLADLEPQIDHPVTSRVDGKDRVVLAPPQAPPVIPRRRPFQSAPLPLLRSPAELAVSKGGARARPARACPICLHPLPATIDYRDPYPIAMVGHTQASKTSTVLALIEGVGRRGPEALGVGSFSATEMTSQYLRSLDLEIFEKFRRGVGPPRTDRRHHPPLEFLTSLSDGRPATVLLHDVAGEDLMDPDTRLERAPMVLWADVIVFIYNPEDSPQQKRRTGQIRMDQGVILNGLRDDLEGRGTHDASNRRYADPPLIVAVSKADLLVPRPDIANGPAPETEVTAAVRKLGDGAVVSAANRWPEIHWRFIAPQPPGGQAEGVIELFRLLLSLLDR